MPVAEIAPINHIVIIDGFPRIAGKGIKVGFIAYMIRRLEMSVEEVANTHRLTLAQVHAAMSYYYDHQAEIDAWQAEQDHIAEELANDPEIQARQADMKARYERMKAEQAQKAQNGTDTEGHD